MAAGQDPVAFWTLTLREIAVVLDGANIRATHDRNRDAWLAWHVAALSRQKRLPKLRDMLPKSKRNAGAHTWQDQLKMIDLINAIHGGDPRKRA